MNLEKKGAFIGIYAFIWKIYTPFLLGKGYVVVKIVKLSTDKDEKRQTAAKDLQFFG
ncbi:hypothetical protein NB647_08420 [Oxalobacter aliiformigenes]|uniref:hypothetical protein n=1 Tax=Oxalobacter aliiformigenes TaxID=2946593 RepID=UPI0022AFD038|nr:hypothetical protein [Oxalobacter aliiformigenes]WAV88891.1 hypothetical protein NB647_08420 [Oxalobacter aliiformigenes]